MKLMFTRNAAPYVESAYFEDHDGDGIEVDIFCDPTSHGLFLQLDPMFIGRDLAREIAAMLLRFADTGSLKEKESE